MDAERFDEISRLFASTVSRRGLLKTIAAASAVLFGARIEDAIAATSCSSDGDCAALAGSTCVSRRCSCPKGTRDCGNACIDVRSNDPLNCGTCGKRCGPDAVCLGGRCTCDGPGIQKCGAECVNTLTNNGHCGACRNVCETCGVYTGSFEAGTCVNGACRPPASMLSQFPNATYCNGECTDLTTDYRNCGSCGNRCRQGIACVDGSCDRCPEGQFICPKLPGCHDFKTDPLHCGGCGKACPEGAQCVGGSCQCPPGQKACPWVTGKKKCVDLKTDMNNCGRCGSGCSAGSNGEICVDGKCECEDPERSHCGDQCIDTSTHNTNCGACKHRCPSCKAVTGENTIGDCRGGVCVPPSALLDDFPGLAICGDKCVDTLSDRKNCGSCGKKCPSGVDCINGRCGCEDGERTCGEGCCDEDRLCCKHACCDEGVTACDGPGRTCGCPEGVNRCGGQCCGDNRICCNNACCAEGVAFCEFSTGNCCPPERTCNGGCCPAGQVCVGGTCCPSGRVCGNTCCPVGGTCTNGVCNDPTCTHPAGWLTIRGEQCCPTGGGNSYFCGPFKCDAALSQSGPGGCDLWCRRPEEGGGCGPGLPGIPTGENNGRACCCGAVASPGICVWP